MWESPNVPLSVPASEFFINEWGYHLNPRWKLGVSAQETANIYHYVIDSNTAR